jgi:V/A-type H+-transporting ATPase subunit K
LNILEKSKKKEEKKMVRAMNSKRFRPLIILVLIFLGFLLVSGLAAAQDNGNTTNGPNGGTVADEKTPEEKAEDTQAMIAIGAALAIGIAGIGSATGIGIAGASGIGAVAEKPDRFGKSLVLQAMPMTQGIYGLLVAILLLMFGGLLGGGGGDVEFLSKPYIGLTAVAIGLAVGLTGISAIGQGITASASIGGAARNPEVFSKGMIFTVMSETLAIFGLLVGILLMVGVGFLG